MTSLRRYFSRQNMDGDVNKLIGGITGPIIKKDMLLSKGELKQFNMQRDALKMATNHDMKPSDHTYSLLQLKKVFLYFCCQRIFWKRTINIIRQSRPYNLELTLITCLHLNNILYRHDESGCMIEHEVRGPTMILLNTCQIHPLLLLYYLIMTYYRFVGFNRYNIE